MLGGGFKHFLFSPLPGEDSHFDKYFFKGVVEPPDWFPLSQPWLKPRWIWMISRLGFVIVLQELMVPTVLIATGPGFAVVDGWRGWGPKLTWARMGFHGYLYRSRSFLYVLILTVKMSVVVLFPVILWYFVIYPLKNDDLQDQNLLSQNVSSILQESKPCVFRSQHLYVEWSWRPATCSSFRKQVKFR